MELTTSPARRQLQELGYATTLVSTTEHNVLRYSLRAQGEGGDLDLRHSVEIDGLVLNSVRYPEQLVQGQLDAAWALVLSKLRTVLLLP